MLLARLPKVEPAIAGEMRPLSQQPGCFCDQILLAKIDENEQT